MKSTPVVLSTPCAARSDVRTPFAMPVPTPKGSSAVMVEALAALRLSQKELAERLGVAPKTISRWCARGAILGRQSVAELCAVVHPADPRLAARIAAVYGEDLAELGIGGPAAPSISSTDSTTAPLLSDTLVCTAADVADVSPRAMRPALVAAFTRARDLGLTIDSALALLSASAAKKR